MENYHNPKDIEKLRQTAKNGHWMEYVQIPMTDTTFGLSIFSTVMSIFPPNCQEMCYHFYQLTFFKLN